MSAHKCPNRLNQACIGSPGYLQHFGHPITGCAACPNRHFPCCVRKVTKNQPPQTRVKITLATTDTTDTFDTTATSTQKDRRSPFFRVLVGTRSIASLQAPGRMESLVAPRLFLIALHVTIRQTSIVTRQEQVKRTNNMEEQVVAPADTETQTEATDDIATFVTRYPFPLDAFQLEAIAHLAQGQSVMVAAPTGTGKTMVAEYAIWRAQQQGQRVIYTTPLKALSNQKYRDLRVLYGDNAVGLVTGDIVERSSASIVVMTTEVYRNMLLEESGERSDDGELAVPSELADVGYIIFDELHFLSDVGRGPVWEEAIICSPPHIGLVGLSATVSNAEDLADWISRVHRSIALVVHEERAVPLEHYYFLDGKLHLVQDADGNRVERFPNVGGEARIAMMKGRNRVYSFGDNEDGDDVDAAESNGIEGMSLAGV